MNTITLPAFTAAGLVHNDATGLLSTGLLVNNDITNGTIDLTNKVTGILPVPNGGTGANTLTDHGVLIGSGISPVSTTATGTAGQVLQSRGNADPSYSTAVYPTTTTINQLLYSSSNNNITGLTTASGGVLNTSSSGVPSITINPVIGVAGGSKGTVSLSGNTSGSVTIQPQAAAGTYNFNLPTGAGTVGQPLLSGGGGAAAMTYGTLGVPAGGTGLTSGNSGGIPYFSSSTTMLSSALLTANGVVIGGGAGTAPSTLALGAMNQLLGMNTGGTANEYKTLSGTTNQINIAFTPGSIVLSTPQNIDFGATPIFAGLTLSGLTPVMASIQQRAGF